MPSRREAAKCRHRPKSESEADHEKTSQAASGIIPATAEAAYEEGCGIEGYAKKLFSK
jgi:hypothetical protein